MENDISPHVHRVFHTRADITIDSVDDAVRDEEAVPQIETPEDVASQKKAAEMQMWWQEEIAKRMGLDNGYNNVAVLLVKWDNGLEDLNTAEETEELRAVFAEQFHYHCNVVELNVKTKPQHQLNRHISAFVEQHDGPDNLMIVYYTGHGVFREDKKFLQLTASINPQRRGFHPDATANWDKAEEHLCSEYVEGDILTILDTCYASNGLQKSAKEDTRTFELLSACTIDQTTARPGPNSFTRALIDALKELLVEFKDGTFTTVHLNQRINLNPSRRDQQSQLWHKLNRHERHIPLVPLKIKQGLNRTPSLLKPTTKGYLTLRFALSYDSLNREQILYLTKQLVVAFKNKQMLGLQKIDWRGLKAAPKIPIGPSILAMYAVAQWKKVVLRARDKKTRGEGSDEANLSADTFVESAPSSTTQKRARETDESARKRARATDEKEGLVVIDRSNGNPPSPPVSNSSRG